MGRWLEAKVAVVTWTSLVNLMKCIANYNMYSVWKGSHAMKGRKYFYGG